MLVVGALAVVVIMVVVVAAVVRSRAAAEAVPQDEPGPVLLVPGYGGTGTSLAPLQAALADQGRTAVIVAPEGDGTGDLAAEAQHLATEAIRIRDEAGAASVDVVGYSAGGVAARLWVRSYGGDAVARRVVTLGSPQHGTSTAALGAAVGGGCPTACEQLAPDSDLLRRLNAGDETPAGPRWVTIRSTADRVVTPVDSAALDGALDLVVQDTCPQARTAHAQLPSDPYVLAALPTTLGVPEPTAPTNVRC